ncbi:MAG: hypothetical protein BGO29_00470 [Bacteroidales bacterium 36-12]|nr:MAG: hypothetical protein BGO29_00470 [Bacteroidales bacterium 36-12]
MKRLQILSFVLLSFACTIHADDYDVVVVGGTPAGITTAIAVAREGKSCLILERTEHIGGLPVNGLGATDIGTRGATTGLFEQFVALNKAYYIEQYGEESPQVQHSSNGYHFEPHVAAKSFEKMINQVSSGKIVILTQRQFDSEPRYVVKNVNQIESIRVLNRQTGDEEYYKAKVFIDATYEGDLGAAAGVPYKLGREGAEEYNEPCAGKIYRWWKHGPDECGTTYQGDNAIQAYNYRLCLTNNPDNRMLAIQPEHYNREEFVSLIDDVLTGRNTDIRFSRVDVEKIEENRQRILNGERTSVPGDPWGMWKLSSMVQLPNMKVDANNQHLALISTDLPEENWAWPTSGWAWRDRFAERLKSYTMGLLWFAQNDEGLPIQFREACKEWGFAKDEYQDNNGFPRQVYVREGRRLEGIHFFTANDALPIKDEDRPPVYTTSVTASHYALDSHAVRKREPGRVHLDGFFSHPTAVYTVPYGVMVPKELDNLLFPVAVSGSHVGFSTLRMEPCWMALGEAAGIAAVLSIDKALSVRDIPMNVLQEKLLNNRATLMYFEDLTPDDVDFIKVQQLALKGFFPDWKVRLDDIIDEDTIDLWTKLTGKRLMKHKGKTTREVMMAIFPN